MYKHAVVMGKFMAPHIWHIHLLKMAIDQCDNVTVILCCSDDDPIEPYRRSNWLIQECPTLKVIPLFWWPLPGDKDYIDWWSQTLERIDLFDVTFTGEGYGDELAKSMGIEQIVIPRGPISSTTILGDPCVNSDYIAKSAKQYFLSRGQ